METTERVVEAYMRYVEDCATIPNIRCTGQHEIDLLAINPKTLERFHIESTVSISNSYRKLTNTSFDPALLKKHVGKAGQRRTLGFFIERKFEPNYVLEALKDYGFEAGNYRKVVVAWDWKPGLAEIASNSGLELWSFQRLMRDIVSGTKGKRHYFTDDTMRVLHLFNEISEHLPAELQ